MTTSMQLDTGATLYDIAALVREVHELMLPLADI